MVKTESLSIPAAQDVLYVCQTYLNSNWKYQDTTEISNKHKTTLKHLFKNNLLPRPLVRSPLNPPLLEDIENYLNPDLLDSPYLIWEKHSWRIFNGELEINEILSLTGSSYHCEEVLIGFDQKRLSEDIIYYTNEIAFELPMTHKLTPTP